MVNKVVYISSITTRQTSRRFRFRFVGRQPGKPHWLATVVNLTGWRAARRLVYTNIGIKHCSG